MNKRLSQALITSIVVSSLIVAPVLAAPQDKVDSLEQQKREAQAQMEDVNSQLVSLLLEYEGLQQDMKKQEEKIAQAESDLDAAEKEEQKQYEDMKLRIKYMYEQGDTSFVEALVTAQSYSELVSKSEYVQKVHDYDREKLEEYVEIKEEVQTLKDDLETGQAEMKDMAQEMSAQKSNLETTLSDMKSQISDFDTQLAQAKEEAAAELARATQQTEAAAAAAVENAVADSSSGSKPSSGSNSKPSGGNSSSGNTGNSGSTGNTANPGNSGSTGNTANSGNSSNAGSSSSSGSASGNPSNASLGQQIANRGCEYIGNKYVYGGNSLTNGIDCSGFVQQIHKQFGISTPRSSGALRTGGKAVSIANMLPGDVICYSGHVAIYIGGGRIVHASNSAPYPKGGIKITNNYAYKTVLAVRRYW
ncbi:NlpC/P60 family protein [Faecalicatena contorta]|uniref:C40 family peptidase n=1 Tax=Faecalicatena contorta TaxID=39482 RepID=UPI001F1A42E7|nr:C40 family peptidase [Faecalicatena contorta]